MAENITRLRENHLVINYLALSKKFPINIEKMLEDLYAVSLDLVKRGVSVDVSFQYNGFRHSSPEINSQIWHWVSNGFLLEGNNSLDISNLGRKVFRKEVIDKKMNQYIDSDVRHLMESSLGKILFLN